MNVFRLLTASVSAAFLLSSASAADVEKTIRLPVLSVSGAPPVGKCRHLNFHYVRRDGDRTPLSIAVVEDTPGGAGESIRASIWLASMVAALERHDDLSGVRISLELNGQIDGPSAGNLICLAILSALEDRDFPDDCTATGSVMPDGTVGVVGAIAEKIKAAAQAGVRRVFVPAYLRFEQDPTTGEEVDLKRLAASVNVELIAAENVAQAYRLLHRQTSQVVAAHDRDVLELPAAAEEVLKQQYQEHRRVGTELWNAISQTERDEIVADPIFKKLFVDELARAERAFRSGRLIHAVTTLWGWRLALEARKRNQETLREVKPDDIRRQNVAGAVAQLDRLIERTIKSVPDMNSLLAANDRNWAESSSQFYADFHGIYGIVGFNPVAQQKINVLAAELARADLKPEERTEYFGALVSYKAIQLFTAHCMKEATQAWQAEADAVVRTLPRRPVTGNVAAVERLFFSAHLAVNNSFLQDVVRSAAVEAQLTERQMLDGLAANDGTLAMHLPAAETSQKLHAELAGIADLRRRRFATAASTNLQAVCLTVMSGLVTRWHELDIEVQEDGTLRYGRTDLVNYLLTTARSNALAAIASCREREIPCFVPIGQFEAAELSRDDVDTDKVDVLMSYWSASLGAKALLMLCRDTINEPLKPALVPAGADAANGPSSAAPKASPTATGGFRLQSPITTSTDRVNRYVPVPHGVPRIVGVPLPRTPGKPVVPPNAAPTSWHRSNGVAGFIAALGFWLWGRRRFGGTKTKDPPSSQAKSDAAT